MPRRALRCVAEVNIHTVSCPGVWLSRRDDLYLTIHMLGQSRRTHLTSPIFPLIFHQKFFFDKVFYTCFEPSQVADSLDNETVLLELVQESGLYAGGRLLASYECNARDFLYPYPQFSPTYSVHDRELLLERSMDFPGIAPKLEFSSATTLEETQVPVVSTLKRDILNDLADDIAAKRASLNRSRRRSRSRSRSRRYSRPTVSSVYRSRSLSPTRLARDLDYLDLNGYTGDERPPPFVVRKVNKDLIGRTPGSPTRSILRRARSPSPRRSLGASARCSQCKASPDHRKCIVCKLYKMYFGKDYEGHTGHRKHGKRVKLTEPGTYIDSDSEVADILSSSRPFTRPRPKSPLLYRSSLRDQFDRPYSPTMSGRIADRVGSALYRNRSVDRLDKYGLYDYDSLDELADDIDYLRRRRYLV